MIVGTAGHIDHGKTALLKALTGQQGDRRREERERGITIDLGYAYADLGDGSLTGFIDVPGHERFVHNMLAGASGIDCMLLVVAADDGVMPQTREHLAIVELLGIRRALVALTKIDRVEPARVEEVRQQHEEISPNCCNPAPWRARQSSRSPRSKTGVSTHCARLCSTRRHASTHVATAAISAWPSTALSASPAPA